MKKIYAIMMMAAALAACSQEDLPQIIEEPEATTYTMSIEATKGDDDSTKALSIDDSGAKNVLNATWATSEHVYVQKGSTWATGSLQPQIAGTSTTLKGSLTIAGGISAGDDLTLQFPRSGARDYTGQVGTLADIAAKYDYATATVKVASISDAGNINPVAATTTFTNQQAIVKFTLKNKATDAAISATQLVVSDGTNTYTVTPASGTDVLYVALPGFSEQTVSLAATVGSDTYTYEKSGVTFTHGQYYEITVKMKLLGFSVSSTKQVDFSPGNLQAVFAEANTSSCTWQFAPNQYSCIGEATANTAVGDNCVTTAGTVDLFAWVGASSSLAAYGINNNLTASNYGNTLGESLKSDWGVVANAASLGGHNDWRTLTKAEWGYLFSTRTNASQKYGHGSVNGVNGMIILPDVWVLPSGLSFTAGNSAWTNSYTTAQWAQMEENGAVFLPAAGRLYGVSVLNVGSYGYYWSATSHESTANYAYRVNFNSGNLKPQDSYNRYSGYSVRLVRDI